MQWSDYDGLSFTHPEEDVLLVTIEGQDKVNSLSHSDHRELSRVWRDISDDETVRVAVVTGAGHAFCAGGNLEWERSIGGNYGEVTEAMTDARNLVSNMIECEKPIVSAVNGAAAGAGLAVAILADISIAATTARLADGHVPIGLAAGDHACLVWPLLCGFAKSKYYLLTGERLDGQEAERIGLVSRAMPEEEVLPEALRVAQRLADAPTNAVQWTKRSLNNWLRTFWPAFEASLALEMMGMFDPEHHQAVEDFINRRSSS